MYTPEQLKELQQGQDPDFYYEAIQAMTQNQDNLPGASFDDAEHFATVVNDRFAKIESNFNALFQRVEEIGMSVNNLWSNKKGYDENRPEGEITTTKPTEEIPMPTATTATTTVSETAPVEELPYFSYRDIETELKDLAKSILVRSESDFSPEVNPTGRIYRLPTDAAIISPADLEKLIEPTKEWEAFGRVLNLYPTSVWRDPKEREGSNVDYIVNLFHPEGLIFIRFRAVET